MMPASVCVRLGSALWRRNLAAETSAINHAARHRRRRGARLIYILLFASLLLRTENANDFLFRTPDVTESAMSCRQTPPGPRRPAPARALFLIATFLVVAACGAAGAAGAATWGNTSRRRHRTETNCKERGLAGPAGRGPGAVVGPLGSAGPASPCTLDSLATLIYFCFLSPESLARPLPCPLLEDAALAARTAARLPGPCLPGPTPPAEISLLQFGASAQQRPIYLERQVTWRYVP